ncbi:MAG: N-acetylmuramoyl-L-alanine amidase [Paracoccus denitrificans]|uniref:N-acetylmuramoyl-L-alanine amidase n=1 Tax=Paracoccus denitrificans TaxID=266 RepID=A0A533I5Z3_PARDE|nr:MAG: N-acetylmuramoyl-L-alanine amidase [Paracoccus denitrificans]
MRWLLLVLALIWPVMVSAQDDAPRLDFKQSYAEGDGDGLRFQLHVTRPVPYRVTLLNDPMRLVVDLKGTAPALGSVSDFGGGSHFADLRAGSNGQGWQRLVFQLATPVAIDSLSMDTEKFGLLKVRLSPVAADAFGGAPNAMSELWNLPQPTTPVIDPTRPRPLRLAIDPGHGGIDSGAVEGGLRESDLMLDFAHELTEKLIRAGFEVVLTRRRDEFVGLETRMTEARASKADLLISLHADALPEGQAAGAAIFTWNSEADDRASQQLAARHDRADLVAGLDLAGTDDQIAATLMDMARADTHPRSEALAQHMSASLAQAGLALRRRPVKGAAFSVLKSPDIPSVLLELGFLTDPGDRANLMSAEWRARMATAVADAVTAWSADDAARATLRRH